MAGERYASLPSTAWGDMQKLPDRGKLLLVYLASSPHSSILNADRQPLGYITVDLEWTREEVREHLELLDGEGWISWDPETSEVAILYAPLRNHLGNSKQVKAAIKAADCLKSKKVAAAVYDTLLHTLSNMDEESVNTLLHTLCDRASIPYRQGFHQNQNQNQVQEQIQEQQQQQKKPEPSIPSESAYRKKRREQERSEIESLFAKGGEQ